MNTHWLEVPQQQRVDVVGTLTAETKELWLGLHGYGQLVQFFSRHFRDLANLHRAFIFPQGPHKFYLEGVHGRVGASWMTKEDRLVDIQTSGPTSTRYFVGQRQKRQMRVYILLDSLKGWPLACATSAMERMRRLVFWRGPGRGRRTWSHGAWRR